MLKLRRSRFPVLPTLLTLGNGTCGLMSIAVSTSAPSGLGVTAAAFYAGVLIYAGMLFDTLDGHVARLAKQTSEFGRQLDSLCDVITFGVAPVFVLLRFSHFYHYRFLWGIGVLFTLCVVLRLARFNVDAKTSENHAYFIGLPSPAAAGTIAAFAVAMPCIIHLNNPSVPEAMQQLGRSSVELIMLCVPILACGLACLMVSRVRYPHIFKQWFQGQRDFNHLVQLTFVVILIVTIHELALPIIFCFFAFGRPVRLVWRKTGALFIRRLPALLRLHT